MAKKRFNKIAQKAFDGFQVDAGMLLNKFDPASPNVQDQDIICATTGGITISAVPSYSDMGEDVDNCPLNMMELKNLDGWDCKISFEALTSSPALLKEALGAADATEDGKITPRRDLKAEDFADRWWVGDRLDGGMVAVCLKNALSSGGLTLKTTKSGKGTVSVELTGHVSMEAQDVMPMEFYSKDPAPEAP